MKKYTLAFLLFCCSATFAQNVSESRSIYDAAEADYQVGRLEEAQQQLTTHLKEFDSSLLQSAYRLLALCKLGMDDTQKAEEYIRLLLEKNPYYSPTANDPPRFIDMIEQIKSGLNATITTASSHAEKLSEVPVPTTLITEEMIKSCGGTNLQEILAAYVPGMTIVDCNDDINIAMRGIYSNGQEKILIMLNGHRLNSFATNIASPDYSISLDKIKQIEVLRGPASSLYGGVALTAVVNIITKQGADVDGFKVSAGVGNYGQLRGGMLFGKRYFDLDLLIWGGLYKATGQKYYLPQEETGLKMEGGDITVGRIGTKPSYDVGVQLRYKDLQFLYNIQFSQVISPTTMTYTFSPYQLDSYHTYNGIRPSFTTTSHHADLSYGRQLGNVYLKGTVTYDNSDLTHYQVIAEPVVSALIDVLPLPETIRQQIKGYGGISRYINGQEHTIGGRLQGDWTYLNNNSHKGTLSFGAEYSYFQLDDVRYTFGYDFTKLIPENDLISNLGKGHESNMNGFLQLKHQWKSFILNAGLRFDYKSRYNDTKIKEFSPRVALIYVRPKWNLKLSYSKSFIDAPYLYRKSNLFLATYMNMPELAEELNPETLHSFQFTFGATQWIPGLNFEFNAFFNKARDLIYLELYEHYNTGNIDTYGLEFSARYERKKFSVNLSTAWQNVSKSQIFSFDNEKAFNTPDFSANAVFTWSPIKNLKLNSQISFYSKQKAFYLDILKYGELSGTSKVYLERLEEYRENPTEQLAQVLAFLEKRMEELETEIRVTEDVKSRIVFNLGARYTIKDLEISFNVRNLFNTKYYQSGMSTLLIPQKGRWFMAEISYKF